MKIINQIHPEILAFIVGFISGVCVFGILFIIYLIWEIKAIKRL